MEALIELSDKSQNNAGRWAGVDRVLTERAKPCYSSLAGAGYLGGVPVQGSSECGAVAFETSGPYGEVIACHCEICRKTSGHFWAAISVSKDNIEFLNRNGLIWYEASDGVRRGFCSECGSSLLFEFTDLKFLGVAPWCIDGSIGMKLAAHIFTEREGDYYELSHALPCFAQHNDKGYGNDP
jgi:hypothetical protein